MIDTFRAVHASGLLLPSRSTITALSLLFEKVYLPANIEAVRAFSERYRFNGDEDEVPQISLTSVHGHNRDPLSSLSPDQRTTAFRCFDRFARSALSYSELFGEVFETNAFEDSKPWKVKLVRQGGPGELNTYEVSPATFQVTEGDDELYPRLVADGYIPIVTVISPDKLNETKRHQPSTQALAALLAMKSVEMVFPRTRAAKPDLILEARERLRGHLPQFWSSMYKLSSELRKLLDPGQSRSTITAEAEDLVNAVVRPALIDLQRKLESERKQWFYNILSPVQKGLRLIMGNPPLTQQQVITNALVLAADVTSDVADHLRSIEALKESAGLTYLLELDRLSSARK